MKNKILHVVREMPLFISVAGTAVILSVFAIFGTRTFLKKYSGINYARMPLYSSIVYALKNEISGGSDGALIPYDVMTEDAREKSINESNKEITGETDKGNSSGVDRENKSGSDKAAYDKLKNITTDINKASDENKSFDKNERIKNKVTEADKNSGADNTSKPQNISGEGENSSQSVSSDKDNQQKDENGRFIIPDGVNSPVCQAVDYGVADRRYMEPAGTAFNTDVAGEFAPDGKYRYLAKTDNDAYFNDALFIGDSRTVGLYDYSGLNKSANFFCKESMNVYHLEDHTMEYYGMNGEKQETKFNDLLSSHQFKKIYVSLGINELGYPVNSYYDSYRKIISDIRNLQPDAVIFIEGCMHVSIDKSSSDSVFNNANVVQRNEAVNSLANGRDIFYIDMNSAVCDANGNLIQDYTKDGIHLKASSYQLWADFLRQNTIDVNSQAK